MIQGSEEWREARLGRVTASRVSDIIAKTKTGSAASRANYAAELIAERLTGMPQERYQNSAMEWGIQTEPEARAAYEFYRDVTVEEVGFIPHPDIPMSGASPDGLVGDNGLVEIKCPNLATHISTLLIPAVPRNYMTQIHWQMACTGRQWCDFVSYDPRMPEDLQLFVKRVHRVDARIDELEDAVCDFLLEVDEKIAWLRGLSADETDAAVDDERAEKAVAEVDQYRRGQMNFRKP